MGEGKESVKESKEHLGGGGTVCWKTESRKRHESEEHNNKENSRIGS